MMRFDDLEHFSDADVEAALARNDPNELRLVPLTLALASGNAASAQFFCTRLASHPDAGTRGNALISLGHLARRFRSLDEPLVKPLIEGGLKDPEDVVRACAKSAADEIHQFQHWIIAGHVYG